VTFHRIVDPERLHALIDAIMLIEVDADLDELLGKIVEGARRLVGARYGALGVLAADRTSLSHFITRGVDDATSAAIGPSPHGRGILGLTIREGRPVRVDDLMTFPTFEGFPAHHPPMHRFLGVPVETSDGQIFGNLYLADRVDGETFTEEDELLVEAFGRAAGLVIDQATMRTHLAELALGEERERLARDLHDTVIQRLFGVGLALQMTLGASMDDSVRTRINSALDELDTTIHEIRTTIFEIDRDDVESGHLRARIEALADEVRTRLGMPVRLHLVDGLDELVGPHCAHHVMQALREALSNVARHANAQSAEVSLGLDGDLVMLSVRDDGDGFSARVGPGRGLRNLTSRARELGGTCVVDSAPGRGTLVQWTALRKD
jgi:signal transduction histidine kinase